MSKQYLTTPSETTGMPSGIPYIIGNEAAERFSFYGMKAILAIYITHFVLGSLGVFHTKTETELDKMTTAQVAEYEQKEEAYKLETEEHKTEATEYTHLFVSAVYFTPIFGAFLSACFIGKYRTILSLSIVYCLGHLALALDETRFYLLLGLTLISFGAGGIKPCVSAHVGDQFGLGNKHLLSRVFSWFYFSINLGAFSSSLLTPILLAKYGPAVAFGVPGVLMVLATILFWMGRNRFIHVPAGGAATFSEAFSAEGLKVLLNLVSVYVFVAVFWSLFDQTASKWVFQAMNMDRVIFGYEFYPSQIQAANPLMILLFIPIFSYVIYPAFDSFFPLTPLRKISIGLFLMVGAFSISALIEARIVAGETPHIIWQLVAYAVLTAAEIMVSITCLEFSYTQSPKKMKSIVMALYLMAVSAGNLLTAGVNWCIGNVAFLQNSDGSTKLDGATYYWFFTGLMLVAAVLFIFVAKCYQGKTYIQGEES